MRERDSLQSAGQDARSSTRVTMSQSRISIFPDTTILDRSYQFQSLAEEDDVQGQVPLPDDEDDSEA